ncbi:MAG: hypothetical protein HY694_00325 [Deltaproteobacteria bacterium]|nr:hypothetical protein [Deltaproteobacteria bacterium]
MRIRLHEDTMNRVREMAQAAHLPAAVIVGELIRNSLNGHGHNGHDGKVAVEVQHLHESKPNPEFRAKLIKGQRGSYGFELTVADADLATVLTQIDRFEEEMLKRYGDEEERQSLKVRKEVAALYGEEP